MKTSLYRLFKGEIFKNKRELGLYFMLLFPIAVFSFVDVYIMYDSTNLTEVCTVNPWVFILQRYIWAFYTLLYPIVISIFCFSLFDIEYKNDYLKKLFTLPVNTSNIFGAKVLYIIMMSFMSAMISYLLLLLSAFILENVYSIYPFNSYDYSFANFIFFIRLFIATLSIASLQLLVSTSFKTFVIPICIAGVGVVLSLISQRAEFVVFIPYFSLFDLMNKYQYGSTDLLGKVEIINVTYIFVFITFAYLKFISLCKKRI